MNIIPSDKCGSVMEVGFSVMSLDFYVQWSSDWLMWQYKSKGNHEVIFSPIYTSNTSPSTQHFTKWVNSTIMFSNIFNRDYKEDVQVKSNEKITIDTIHQYPDLWEEMKHNCHVILNNHRRSVFENMKIMKEHFANTNKNLSMEIYFRALAHDESKLKNPEFEPYVWRYWRAKWNKDGKVDTRFSMIFDEKPTFKDQYIRDAIVHHVNHNRHHPEWHLDHDDMTELDLIEMVCDWYAVSEEFNSSIDDWVAYVVPRRYHFSADKLSTIHQLISILQQQKGLV